VLNVLVSAAPPAPAPAWSISAFALHPVAWGCVLGAAVLYAAMIRMPRFAVSSRQAWCFLAALGVLLIAYTWPLADLATHSLLLALVTQRLLVLLAFPSLFLAGLPAALVAAATRPPALDTLARLCSRPVPAVAIVTAVAVGTLTVPAVDAQSSTLAVRGVLDVVLIVAGVVLWMPVRHPVPGTQHMSALGEAGYLVVQSIVPGFLSIVWIFARHPLYGPYTHSGHVLWLSPLLDQQLSGFVAKLGMIAVLWTVAFVHVMRAERAAEDGEDAEPLTWADVERQLERAERKDRNAPTSRRPPP
jgi:cytochrome c oxidase assembly factor CtaG